MPARRPVTPINPADVSLAAILALLVDEREDRIRDDKDARKTEVLLGAAGMSVEAIASITGKKADAVRKAIQRGRM